MSLAVHNVVQLSDADVRQRFVVRRTELAELLAHLREPDPPRHALVIGPRGTGKSLLLRRVAIEVADDAELAARWLPVLMAEELYEVTSIGELWLAALARLAAIVGDAELVAQHRALLAEPDPARLEALALQRLLGAARARGRRVLLLAENLDMLLGDQVPGDEGWTLRQALQTEPGLLLMASAVATFAQVQDEGEALYGFFHRVDLRPLDDAEVRTLWREVTGVDLAGDRVTPIRILTGGNPRLVTVLGRFSEHPDLSGLRQDLELLIDEYTPYFKANVEALPPVERKVFVKLADIWAPATAAEVAARARIDTSKVSALLGRLMRRGVVQVFEEAPGRRRYEVTERLYNIYHLLRSPGDDGRVRALVDILVHLYEPGRLEADVWPSIVRPGPEAPSVLDVAVASGLHRCLDDAGAWDGLPPAELALRLPVFRAQLESQRASLGDDHPDTLLTRQQIASFIGASGDPSQALRLSAEVLDDQRRVLGPDHRYTLTCRAQVAYYTGETGDPAAALDLYRRVAADQERALGPDHRDTLTCRAQAAYYTGETGDPAVALDLYRRVAADQERTLGPDDRDTLVSRAQAAFYTGATGDPVAALDLYRRVAADQERTLGPDHRDTLVSRHQLAYFTGETGDPGAALEIAEDVLQRAEKTASVALPHIRLLVAQLRLRLGMEPGRPAPRELRELEEVLERRQT